MCRAGNLHVRALSSGKVHPGVFHSGAFDMGIGAFDMAGTLVVCCDYLAAVVHGQDLSQSSMLVIKGTVIVWNWRAGNQVVVLVRFPQLDVLHHGPYSLATSFVATTICTS